MAKAKAKSEVKKRLERAGLDDDDDRFGQVRLLSLTGKGAGQSEAIGDDPFAQQGLYNTSNTRSRWKVLAPPLGVGSLEALVNHANESDILPQCIRSFETNIEGFGHRLEPIVDPEQTGAPDMESSEAQDEKAWLESFLTYCYDKGSFVELRRRKRNDQESTGIGYWEVIRDLKGDVIALNHVPAHTIRMTPEDREVTVVDETRRVGLNVEKVKVPRRFRSFCHIARRAGREQVVWFKEFGDPRHLNLETGTYYAKTHQGDKEANELIAFPVRYFALSPYSLPRWMGNLPAVLGSKAADEVNLLYFDNKTIPPLAVMVSGGLLTRGTVRRIEQLFEENKGRENFHKALIIEAAPPKDDGSQPERRQLPRITMQPLTEAVVRDAMFLGYGANNRMRTRSAFNLPPIFTGETEDYTRATAESSLAMAEDQVFQPERLEFDFWLNRRLAPSLRGGEGLKFWKIVSAGPNVTKNEDLIQLLTSGEPSGGLTPNLARTIISDILEQPVPTIEEPWGDLPFSLTKAAFAPTFPPAGGGGQGGEETPPGEEEKRVRVMREIVKRLPTAMKRAVIDEFRGEVRKALNARDGDLLKLVERRLAGVEAD